LNKPREDESHEEKRKHCRFAHDFVALFFSSRNFRRREREYAFQEERESEREIVFFLKKRMKNQD